MMIKERRKEMKILESKGDRIEILNAKINKLMTKEILDTNRLNITYNPFVS